METPISDERPQLTPAEMYAEMTRAKPVPEIYRGLELVRWEQMEWRVIAKYRPTEVGARQAAADFKWRRDRDPTGSYDLRAVVSVQRQQPQEVSAPQATVDVNQPSSAGVQGDRGDHTLPEERR